MFDPADQLILTTLLCEGRASHAELATKLAISASAVRERIRKLERTGVITGYRAILDSERVGLAIRAFVRITPQPRKPAEALVERLLQLPEIEELHAVAGEYAYIAKVRVATTTALDAFLDRLYMLEGVERTHTTMVLRTNVERPMHLPFENDTAS